MTRLSFENYAEALKIYLRKYREVRHASPLHHASSATAALNDLSNRRFGTIRPITRVTIVSLSTVAEISRQTVTQQTRAPRCTFRSRLLCCLIRHWDLLAAHRIMARGRDQRSEVPWIRFPARRRILLDRPLVLNNSITRITIFFVGSIYAESQTIHADPTTHCCSFHRLASFSQGT